MEVAKALAAEPNEQDVYAALEAADYLETQLENERCATFLDRLYQSLPGSFYEGELWSRLLTQLGSVYSDQGAYNRALEHYEKSLVIRLQVNGHHHPDVATRYNKIGSV